MKSILKISSFLWSIYLWKPRSDCMGNQNHQIFISIFKWLQNFLNSLCPMEVIERNSSEECQRLERRRGVFKKVIQSILDNAWKLKFQSLRHFQSLILHRQRLQILFKREKHQKSDLVREKEINHWVFVLKSLYFSIDTLMNFSQKIVNVGE